ncbi:HAD family hydrolase [Lacticaseibacillus suihuaensis]
MIRMIFSDMDGTLLDDHGDVTATNAALIRKAALPVTLVSARAPIEMAAAIDALGLTGPQIGFNGGLIYQPTEDGYRPLVATLMVPATAKAIITAVGARFPGVSLSYYTATDWFAPRMDAGLEHEVAVSHLYPTIRPTAAVLAQPDLAFFKIMMIALDPAELVRLQAFFTAQGWPDIAVQRSGTAWLEVTAAAAQKSTGIRYILDRFALGQAETAAFGDGHNDLPMFEAVGHAIAMQNALPEIKQRADAVTAANTEDGVGRGIWQFLMP